VAFGTIFGHLEDYAGAWTAEGRRCHRLVYGTEDRPTHCPEPTVTSSWVRDGRAAGTSSTPATAMRPRSTLSPSTRDRREIMRYGSLGRGPKRTLAPAGKNPSLAFGARGSVRGATATYVVDRPS